MNQISQSFLCSWIVWLFLSHDPSGPAFLPTWVSVCVPVPGPAAGLSAAATNRHTAHFLASEPGAPESGHTRIPEAGGGPTQPVWIRTRHRSPVEGAGPQCRFHFVKQDSRAETLKPCRRCTFFRLTETWCLFFCSPRSLLLNCTRSVFLRVRNVFVIAVITVSEPNPSQGAEVVFTRPLSRGSCPLCLQHTRPKPCKRRKLPEISIKFIISNVSLTKNPSNTITLNIIYQ